MRHAERLTAPFAYHGEGPFWDAVGGRLLCMDVLAGDIVAVSPSGRLTRYETPSRVVTVARRRARGGFVIATEHGVVAADDELSTFDPIADVTDDQGVRTNDGGCDPFGGFIIGTMDYDGRPDRGAVYRVAPDHRVTELYAPVSISNGVQWSADGSCVYYIDTPTRRVDVFDVEPGTGAWSRRRPHIRLEEDTAGSPDGMAIDEDGGLWVALWGGGVVNHYDPDGRLVEAIGVPGVTQPSSCAFGGDGRDVLYITTSREGLPDGCEPDAGAVFAVQTSARGAVQSEFGG